MQFKTSFILAAFMAMNAVVTAQPIAFGLAGFVKHPGHVQITTTRTVFFKIVHRITISPHLVRDFYDMVVTTIIHRQVRVVPPHLEPLYRAISARDDIEERSFWDADDQLESRELDDEPTVL